MVSRRVQAIDASGIRKVFDLASSLKDPINLSIGQPDFDTWDTVKDAIKCAVDEGRNSYTVTQGISELREKIRKFYAVDDLPNGKDLDVFITAGVSGGLFLSFMTLLDPDDEVLIPDPFFVIYRDLAVMLNAKPVCYNTYPDFSLKSDVIESAISSKTKAIIINTPANPTGYVCSQAELDAVIEVARRHNLYVIFDEIYSCFCFDSLHPKCLGSYDKIILLSGFSKWAGVPGWRMGYVIAPKEICFQMLKVQQYSIVCAHSASQWAMLKALDYDFSKIAHEYKRKRDFICDGLNGYYDFVKPGGAFYLFPSAPGGSGQKFVEKCIANNLLVIPGGVFSKVDTHFRISFSAPMEKLEMGVDVLRRLSRSY